MSGPQCCSNAPTLDPNSGVGRVERVAGLDSYVSGSLDSKLGVLLISDIFGYEAPNIRLVADKIAAAGFYVVVPDFFYGDPFVWDDAERPLPVWLKDHGTDKGFEDAKPVIEALKSKGISAIGAVGYCWGAKVVLQLGNPDFIKAAVLCHPAFVTIDDFGEVKVPVSILGAEIDEMCPPALLKQFEEVLAARSDVIDSFVKMFPKAVHGWTIRYSLEDEAAVKSAKEALADTLEWLTKYVK